MHKSTRLLIAARFVILNIVILNAIVLVFLVKSDGPDNGLSECVQKTKSIELCATAYH
jgi:hypothetical protein